MAGMRHGEHIVKAAEQNRPTVIHKVLKYAEQLFR